MFLISLNWDDLGLLYFQTASTLLSPVRCNNNCYSTPLRYNMVAYVLMPDWLVQFQLRPLASTISYIHICQLVYTNSLRNESDRQTCHWSAVKRSRVYYINALLIKFNDSIAVFRISIMIDLFDVYRPVFRSSFVCFRQFPCKFNVFTSSIRSKGKLISI